MANTIDQRIVEMSFDNSKFNSNAEASIGVLDKLKKALKLDGSQDAFNKLESSSKKVNLSGLMSAVESISSKFTNLGIVGVTALQNITNSAINAGKNLISSLTIDPVMTGYNEYELKLNSIQTILANTQKEGATLEDVNRILNDLNTYADKTIYNFAQMTHNIGSFTAAGVDLQTSANAIKGIANLAALSGSNATQASTAMYQFSQAIAAGRVSLQDWNSVVNAGMGGQIFQDALRDTAEAMGIVVDRTQSFRDSISAAGGATSWLTSDVLVSTLEIFTGDLTEAELAARGFNNEQIAYYLRLGKTAVDSATKVRNLSQLLNTLKESVQSGWATTWEIIFGNFEEATELFTNINDVVGGFFNNMSDARNAMLLTWKDMGGREKLIENLSMAFRALQRVVEPVIKAFQNIFPPATAQQLMSFLGNIRTLAQTFMLSRNEMRKLQNAFEGLFSIIDIVGMTVSDVLSVAFDALNLVFDTFGGSVLDVASNLGEAIKAFRDWYKEVRPLKNGLEGLVNVARIVVTVAREIASTVMQIPAVQSTIESIKTAFSNISATLQEAWGYVLEFVDGLMNLETISFDNIKTLFNQLLSNFSKLDINLDSLGTAFDNIKNVASAALTQVSKAFENVKGVASSVAEFIKNIFSKINLGHILTVALAGTVIASLLSIKRLMDAIAEPIEAFTGMFKGVTNVLNAFAEKIKPNRFAENAKAIRDLAIAIGILAVSLAVLSKMDQQKLREAATTLGVLSGALIVLNGVMTLISKLGKGSGDVKGVSVNMLSAAASILIMVQALKQLQNLDQNGILKSLGIMAALMAGLSAMTIAISKFAPKLSTGSIMMLSSSASLLLMVKSLEQLQGMNLNGVEDSLQIMVVCMGLLAAVSIAAGKIKAGTAVGMLGIVASLALLVEVLKQVMALDLSGAESNIAAITAVILSFVALVGVSSLGGENAQKAGVGILAMSASLLLIIEAIRQISKIDATEVSRAIGVITQIELLFGAIVALSHFAGANAAKAGVGILAMSAAVVVLSGAMAILATIDPAGLNRALEAVTVLGVIFSMILVATAVAKDASKQLIIATACVTVLAAVTAALGLIDPNQLQNGLAAVTLLGVVLSGLLVATKFSGPVNANLILATLAVGALGLVIAGLAQLPVGTAIPIAESLSVLMLAMSAAMLIVSKLPITGALTAVANLGIFIAGLTAVVAAIGGIAQIPGAKWLISEGAAFLQSLGAALGGFVGGIVGGVVGGAIATISATLPGVAENLSSFMEKLQPFLDGLNGVTPDIVTNAKAVVDAWVTLTTGIFLSGSAGTLYTVATNAINTFVTEITNGTERAKTAISTLMSAMRQAFMTNAVVFNTTGTTLINNFITGVTSRKEATRVAGVNVKNALATGLRTNQEEFKTIGTTLINKFTTGATSRKEATRVVGVNVKNALATGLKTNQEEFKTIGTNTGSKYASGVHSTESEARSAGTALSDGASAEVEKAVSRFEEAGKNAGKGFANAIRSYASEAISAAREMAQSAADAINSTLDINSPSKVTGLSGKFFVLGFANAVRNLSYLASDSASDMGKRSVSAFQKSVEDAGEAARSIVDLYPTITPVLDLSQIQNGSRNLGSIFANHSIALAETSTRQVSSIARHSSSNGASAESKVVSAQPASFNFTQNNYSPKALSNIEIYRQTRNLVSQAKAKVSK